MRIARIIGNVTLSRWHPTLTGASYRVAVPLTRDELRDPEHATSEPLIVYDDLGAGDGSLIAVSEGGEAAQPFYPDDKPIDAYNAAILDNLDIEPPGSA